MQNPTKNWKVVSITPGDGLGGASTMDGLSREEAEEIVAAYKRDRRPGNHAAREMSPSDFAPVAAKRYHRGRWR